MIDHIGITVSNIEKSKFFISRPWVHLGTLLSLTNLNPLALEFRKVISNPFQTSRPHSPPGIKAHRAAGQRLPVPAGWCLGEGSASFRRRVVFG